MADPEYVKIVLQGGEAIRSLELANVYGVKDPPEGFLDWAIWTMRAVYMHSPNEWRKMIQRGHWPEDRLRLSLRWVDTCRILLPSKTWGFGTEYTVADTEGGQPCDDGNGMPKPKQ